MGQKQGKLRQDVVDELVRQTAFTEAEVQDWYKGFVKDCPSGHLTLDEFKRVYTKFFPYGEASRFAEYVFRTFDRNRDGIIDFREFLCTLSTTSRGTLEQKLQWAFSMYDLDGDGYLSRQDVTDVIASIYNMIGTAIKLPDDEATPERRSEKLFNQMDTDRDNRLSLEEFMLGVKSDKWMLKVLAMNTNERDPRPDTGEADTKVDHSPSNGPSLERTQSYADNFLSKSGADTSTSGAT